MEFHGNSKQKINQTSKNDPFGPFDFGHHSFLQRINDHTTHAFRPVAVAANWLQPQQVSYILSSLIRTNTFFNRIQLCII